MHSREFLILAILIIFLLISCHIFEPDDENGSLLIEIASETTSSLSESLETISSVRCLVSKGSRERYDQEHTKTEGGKFSITIDDLKPADNYSVLLYGKNSQEDIIGRAYQENIRIIARIESQISMTWTGMQVVLQTPADSSTISDDTPSFTWSAVSSASFYALQVDSSNNFSSPVIDHSSLTSTGYTSPEALADNTYYWRVRCQDSEENWGGWSSMNCFTINTQGLAAPTLQSPADESTIFNDTPSFTWSGVSGAVSYALEVDISDNFSEPVINQSDLSDTSYTATSTLSDATYYWRVRGQDSQDTWGAWSDTWSFSINTQGPTAPTLISPENESTITDNTPSFTWSAVSNVAGYELQVDLSNDFTAPVINQSSLTATGYTSPSALSDTTYYWRVRCQDSQDNWGAWSDTWSFTIYTQIIGIPTLNLPEKGSTVKDENPSFAWSLVNNAVYYELQVDSSVTFSAPLVDQQDLTTTVYTASSAFADNTYYWRVRGQDSQDNWGEWSDIWSFTISTKTIKVTSPNGGESWELGSDHTITWTNSNTGGEVKIELYKGSNLDTTLTSNTPDDGSYNWSIPTNSDIASTYKIKITSTGDADNYDYSDGDFILYSSDYIRIYGVCFVYYASDTTLHVGDVTITFDTDIGGTMTTTTDEQYGYYDETVPYGWSGTVSASKPEYDFKCDYQGDLQSEYYFDNINQDTKVDFWDDRSDLDVVKVTIEGMNVWLNSWWNSFSIIIDGDLLTDDDFFYGWQIRYWKPGSKHTLESREQFMTGPIDYYYNVFTNWENGSVNAYREVIIPEQDVTYSAEYLAYYQLFCGASSNNPNYGTVEVTPLNSYCGQTIEDGGTWENSKARYRLKAIPESGHQFVEWRAEWRSIDYVLSTELEIEVGPGYDQIEAIFE